MKKLLLKRVVSGPDGSFGVLIEEGLPFAVTLELPWKNNEKNVSCIPAGTYLCKLVNSPRFGNTFEITGVDGRTHILFHIANILADLLGCVAVAESFNPVLGVEAGVTQSKKGFNEFMGKYKEAIEFTLTIENCF